MVLACLFHSESISKKLLEQGTDPNVVSTVFYGNDTQYKNVKLNALQAAIKNPIGGPYHIESSNSEEIPNLVKLLIN